MADFDFKEAGKKGGYIRWHKIKPKDRSKIMSEVAKARYAKKTDTGNS